MSNILTVTNGNDSGPGSLRDNIATANLNPLITTINFNQTVTLVTLTSGSLNIKRSYNITGLGVNPTIDATNNGLSTIFVCSNIGTGTVVVDIDNVRLFGSNNGAINANNVSLNLTNVVIDGNDTLSSGGGIVIFSTVCNIVSCVLRNNHASSGGGIYSLDSDIFINLSTIDNNTANEFAAGLILSRTYTTILNSCISNNTVYSIPRITNGAGLHISGSRMSGNVNTISNCTISNNNIQSGLGGGIYLIATTLEINNSTIAYNSSSNGGGIYIYLHVFHRLSYL